jgi:hypothetical protein
MNWFRFKTLGPTVALLFVFSMASCGKSKTATVEGRITYYGKPVPRGSIIFNPEVSGAPSTGEIKPDGSYKLRTPHAGNSVVVGSHLVMIESRDDHRRLIVPVKYTSIGSGLKADVKEGPNTIDFDLVDDEPKN